MASPPDEIFRRGFGFLQAGKLADAERSFKELLRAQPRHAGALNLLSIVMTQLGRLAEAEDYVRRALEENATSDVTFYNYGLILKALNRPAEALQRFDQALAINAGVPETWNSRGTVFNDLGRYKEAIADFDKALSLNSNFTDALCNKGKSLAGLKFHDQALAAYIKALAINPALVEAWIGRGNVHIATRQYNEALADYDKARSIKGDFAEAWLGCGNAFTDLKRYDEALGVFDRALSLKPDLAEAWLGRGKVFGNLKRFDEAFAAYDKALTLRADLAEAWVGRGNVYMDLKRYNDASAAYGKALALNVDLADAWLGQGNIFTSLNRYDEALAAYDKALSLKPDLAEAWLGRGNVFNDLKRYDDAFAAYDKALALKHDLTGVEGNRLITKMLCCDWKDYDAECAHLILSLKKKIVSAQPFPLLALPSSSADQLQCAQLYAAENYPALPPLWRGERYNHDRIRVAYLSADFRQHAVSYLTAGIFECHDKSRFETTAISWGLDDNSEIRGRIMKSVDRFVDVRTQEDAKIAELVREMEIDIAVDLMGFTWGSRTSIFARRPAPIQVNYLGYLGTMGAPYIDYIIADRILIPADRHEFYSEKVVYLPNSFQANDRERRVADKIFTRAEAGLPQDGFVFCCFNHNYKITPGVFDIWMRILKQVDGSALWLVGAGPTMERNLRSEATARGVNAERLVFARLLPLPEHQARLRLADLFLDTSPYNAGTTASDALWVGLPVLTRIGDTFAGRMAASLLSAMGLTELITTTPTAYETLAIDLATQPNRLADIKQKVAKNRLTMPLFDTRLFTKHIEAAYTEMYERQRTQMGPPDQAS